jgi:hypothetical protein
MNNSNEFCGGKPDCLSKIMFACNCGNPVVFLCQDCVASHLLEPRTHLFLQPDQARELLRKTDFSKRYAKVYAKYIEIKDEVLGYIEKLKEFKARVSDFKIEIMKEIETVIEFKLKKIDENLEYTYIKLEELNKVTADLNMVNHEILRRYEAKGLHGFLDNYLENISFNESKIKLELDKMINVEYNDVVQDGEKLLESAEPVREIQQIGHKQETILKIQIRNLKRDIEEMKQMNALKVEELRQHIEKTIPKLYEIEARMHRESRKDKDQIINCLIQVRDLLSEQPKQTKKLPTLKLEELKKSLDTLIPDPNSSISDSVSDPSCIFVTKNDTKDLIKYDTDLDILLHYPLDTVIHSFNSSATCLLPPSHILISGGRDSNNIYLGHTYQVNITSNPPVAIKLGDLNYPRNGARLLWYRDYAYILGGWNGSSMNKCERMRLGSKWHLLPDMKQPRFDFGVFMKEDRIFVVGGYGADSIEYFDISQNSFYLVQGFEMMNQRVICGVIDSVIYMIGKNLRIVNQEIRNLNFQENISSRNPCCYSNVIVRENKIVFVNSGVNKVCVFDVDRRVVTETTNI